MAKDTIKSLKAELKRQETLHQASNDAHENIQRDLRVKYNEAVQREHRHLGFIRQTFVNTTNALKSAHENQGVQFDFTKMLVDVAKHLGADL